jgi:outer membrane protein assembly factor BamA
MNLEIHDINFQFTNTQSFKVSELELLIESPKNEFLNLQTLNLDVRRLDKFYFDNGFFDTNIDTNIILLKNNKVDITFIINENEPYYIRNIIYSGLDNVRLDVLNRMNENSKPFLKVDEIYSKNNLYSEGNRIISFLNDNGYAIANLKEPEVIKMYSYEKNSRKTVDVKINIDAD